MAEQADRPITMKTLADALGVSVTTVSNAYSRPDRISKDLRERVLAGGKELGYAGPSAAARALRSGRTDVCGFLYGGELAQAFSDPYVAIFLTGLGETVETYGSSVLLLRSPHGDEPEAQLLRRAAIDALVLTLPRTQHPSLSELAGRGVRIVGTQADAEGDWVAIDDVAAGRQVGRHLAELGHRDIAVVVPSHQPGQPGATPAAAADVVAGSFEGQRLAGLAAELPGARVRVFRAGQYGRESGRLAGTAALEDAAPPTAIVGVSDVLALGVRDAARARGLALGSELSIVGFDDIPDAARVGLTTVRQPMREKGRLAGRLAMDPDFSDRQILLPTELVVRSSSGPAPR